MGDQTEAGNLEEPFVFQPTSLPFEVPEIRRALPEAPRPNALDFDAFTVAPDERHVPLRSRFARPQTESSIGRTADVVPDVPTAEATGAVVTSGQPAGFSEPIETGEPDRRTGVAPSRIGDFDPDDSVVAGTTRGMLAMAGVACVALFMTAVALVRPDGGSVPAPAELARRESPVEVRSGVADQAFEHTIASHELSGESVKPIIADACARLGDGDDAVDVEAGARAQLLALSPALSAAEGDAIFAAGIESHCMEHLLAVLSE